MRLHDVYVYTNAVYDDMNRMSILNVCFFLNPSHSRSVAVCSPQNDRFYFSAFCFSSLRSAEREFSNGHWFFVVRSFFPFFGILYVRVLRSITLYIYVRCAYADWCGEEEKRFFIPNRFENFLLLLSSLVFRWTHRLYYRIKGLANITKHLPNYGLKYR